MSDTAYDGIFGGGFAFTFTPSPGTPFGTAQARVEEATPAKLTLATAKITPISGNPSSEELPVPTNHPLGEYGMKWVYNAGAYAAAIACMNGRTKGTLACIYGDGSAESWSNALLTMVDQGQNTATATREGNLTFTCPTGASYSFTPGSGLSPVQESIVLGAGGTATLDMTAAPFSGGTKVPFRIFVLNPATNANSITIAKGASSGYTGLGTTFTQTLLPGESASYFPTTALSPTVKDLDLSGTAGQALVVQIQFQ